MSSSQLRTSAGGHQQSAKVSAGFDRMERTVGELQRRVLDLRTTPLLRVMDSLPRTARQIAERCGKRVEVELLGTELELDRSILDRLGEPLLHMVRNAVDHGIESPEGRRAAGKDEVGHLIIEARRQKNSIHIEVRDDGAGIDLDAVRQRAVQSGLVHADLAEDMPPEEIAALVFHAGLSTAENVSEVSGRGVGMDAVKATVESLGGNVNLRTERGRGTAAEMIVPITAAIQRVLLVGIGEERVAIPVAKVERILEVPSSTIECGGRESFVLIDEDPVLVLDLAERLALGEAQSLEPVPLALVELRGERVALRVDRFIGQQEIYLKPIPDLLACVRVLAGLTVMGDGRPVFLLDLNQLA